MGHHNKSWCVRRLSVREAGVKARILKHLPFSAGQGWMVAIPQSAG